MVGKSYVYIDTILAFYGYADYFHPSLLLSWMFEHDCLDTNWGVLYMHVFYICILVQRN